MAALLFCSSSMARQSESANASYGGTGIPQISGQAREANLGEIPEATAAELAVHPRVARPLNGLNDTEYYRLKTQSRAQAAGPTPGISTLPPSDVRANTIVSTANFDGLTETAAGGNTPSDMALAVGPTYVLQAVNSAITVLSKTGVVQAGFPKSMNTFFNLAPTAYTTDPRAFYDWGNGRYVIILLQETDRMAGDNVGNLLLAASQTNDPRGAWYVYSPAFQIGATGECPDYPTLGQDHEKWKGSTSGGIYVGINQFGPAPDACNFTTDMFIQNYVFLLPKTKVYTGATFQFWTQSGLNVSGSLVDTIQPATVFNTADKPEAVLMVNSQNIIWGGHCLTSGSCESLEVWSVSNPFAFLMGGNSPQFTGITIGVNQNLFTYQMPLSADEPGCSECIDTGDTRISGSINYSAGSIYLSLNSRYNSRSDIPWAELHPMLNDNGQITSVDLRQVGYCVICTGTGRAAYYGTVQSDPEGNVIMVYNYSDDSTYPGVSYASRRVTQADGVFHDAGIALISGQGNYAQARWGDYEGTAIDFQSTTSPSIWFSGMYSRADGTWGTRVGKATFTNSNN
jgi:hypothetical protein